MMLPLLPLLLASQVSSTSQIVKSGSSEPTSKIIFYRGSSIVGSAIGCPIRYKGQELVELGRGKFAEWSVEPGSYIVNNKTSSIEINLAAGQKKYVRCMIKSGFMTGRADLQIVDEESFSLHAADYERKEVSAPESQ